MAFSAQTLRIVLRRSSSSAARGFSVAPHSPPHGCPIKQLESHLPDFKTSLSPTVLPLKTSFNGPNTYTSTGIFLEPGLIATPASAVGRITSSYDQFKPDRIRHKPVIGRTVAFTAAGKTLETKPLAVSFSGDIAVLKVVNPDGEIFPNCALASSAARKGEFLFSVFHRGSSDWNPEIMLGRVREEKTIMINPEWPDNVAIEHPKFVWEEVNDSKGTVTGSPWFNISSELMGITSYGSVCRISGFSLGSAVPCSWIRIVLEYAKTKRTLDPIVMDRFLDKDQEDSGSFFGQFWVSLNTQMNACVHTLFGSK